MPIDLVEIVGGEILGANRDAGMRVMGDILRVNMALQHQGKDFQKFPL